MTAPAGGPVTAPARGPVTAHARGPSAEVHHGARVGGGVVLDGVEQRLQVRARLDVGHKLGELQVLICNKPRCKGGNVRSARWNLGKPTERWTAMKVFSPVWVIRRLT